MPLAIGTGPGFTTVHVLMERKTLRETTTGQTGETIAKWKDECPSEQPLENNCGRTRYARSFTNTRPNVCLREKRFFSRFVHAVSDSITKQSHASTECPGSVNNIDGS